MMVYSVGDDKPLRYKKRALIVLWHFFDNQTGHHYETPGLGPVTATNGACLRLANPPKHLPLSTVLRVRFPG
jgi:hypothetical protein